MAIVDSAPARCWLLVAAMAVLTLRPAGWSAAAQREDDDPRAINRAKSVRVRTLDPTLADQTFERWLTGELGPEFAVSWSVTDCGEQTGGPADRGRDLPTCVEALATRPDRVIVAFQILVGSSVRGFDGEPRLYWASFQRGGGFKELRALRDLRTELAAFGPVRDAARIRFSVLETAEGLEQPIGRDLVLSVRRARHANGSVLGWNLGVRDRRITASPNFFEECLCGHGPVAHEVYAWHFIADELPRVRQLPIYGYPWTVEVACQDCRVAREGTAHVFVSGVVEVSWRRERVDHPRQRRPGR